MFRSLRLFKMALEFLLSVKIEPWKKTRIKIPAGASCYRNKSGGVRFFKSNPEDKFNKIPKGASEIEFYMEKNSYNIEYGRPCFYDSKGEILKIGNR
jgi:hypothetical protein